MKNSFINYYRRKYLDRLIGEIEMKHLENVYNYPAGITTPVLDV